MSFSNWIGQTIGGRYKIEALLGQGGMSAVYRGIDPNLRRTIALKLIHPHLSSDAEFVRRFEQEAAAVAQLRHPNIIQVYDFNHDNEVYYMVLEYVPGETLQAKLKALHSAGQRLSLTEAVRIMATVTDAVEYAHRRGMVHRDLKPANVMLNQESQPILMDFGVAKMLTGTQHTATGTLVGTVAYMSPEQIKGSRVDERADIYSLGVMLFEMVAGRPPFEGDSAMTVMFKHVNEPPPDIRQYNSELPEGVREVIQRALAKEAEDRYQHASDLASALRGVRLTATYVEPPTQQRPVKPVEPVRSTEQPKALEVPRPVEPVAQPKPVEQPKIIETPKPVEQPRSGEPAKPTPVVSKAEDKTLIEPPVVVQPAVTPELAKPVVPVSKSEPAVKPVISTTSTLPPEVKLGGATSEPKKGLPMPLILAGIGGLALVACVAVALIFGPTLLGGGTSTQAVNTAVPTVVVVVEATNTTVPQTTNTAAPLPTETAVPPTATDAPTPTPSNTPAPVPPAGMVLIPAGSFTMGSTTGQADERPPHPVNIQDFFMDETEVTNAAYGECVTAGNCSRPQVTGSTTRANYFTRPEFANFPVIQVTWQQAVDYCVFRDKRLPTEAEWEYAARGDTNRVFPWGDEFDVARVPGLVPDTVEVGTLDNASIFGVKDLSGNVGEWVADWYAVDYYANSATDNPPGPDTGRQKVYRGGSFDNPNGIFYTTTRRYRQGPGFRDVDIGFRCAANVP